MLSIIRDPRVAIMLLSFRKIRKRLCCLNISDLFTSKSLFRSDQSLIIDIKRRFCPIPLQESGKAVKALFEPVKPGSGIFDRLLDDIGPDLFQPGIVFALFELCQLSPDGSFFYES